MTIRPLALLATTLSITVALSACTSAPPPDTGRLAPSFRALAQQYLDWYGNEMSDWDRAVVEKAARTGHISQADYDEGADNFEACMIAGGERWTRTRHLNGVVEFQPPQGSTTAEEDDNRVRVQGECYTSGYAGTQELFAIQQVNPELLSNFSLVALNCLKKAGMLAEDFPLDEYERVMGPHDFPVEYPFERHGPAVADVPVVDGLRDLGRRGMT